MRRFYPSIFTVILFNILGSACFILITTNSFVPWLTNVLGIATFAFAVLAYLTLLIFIFQRAWHILVRFLIAAPVAAIGGAMLFYVFVFSGFIVRDYERIDYNNETYYFQRDAAVYLSNSIYKKTGPFTTRRLDGMTQEERRSEYNEQMVKEIIDRID